MLFWALMSRFSWTDVLKPSEWIFLRRSACMVRNSTCKLCGNPGNHFYVNNQREIWKNRNLEEIVIRKLVIHTNYLQKIQNVCKLQSNYRDVYVFRSNFNGIIYLIFRIIYRWNFLPWPVTSNSVAWIALNMVEKMVVKLFVKTRLALLYQGILVNHT